MKSVETIPEIPIWDTRSMEIEKVTVDDNTHQWRRVS